MICFQRCKEGFNHAAAVIEITWCQEKGVFKRQVLQWNLVSVVNEKSLGYYFDTLLNFFFILILCFLTW